MVCSGVGLVGLVGLSCVVVLICVFDLQKPAPPKDEPKAKKPVVKVTPHMYKYMHTQIQTYICMQAHAERERDKCLHVVLHV